LKVKPWKGEADGRFCYDFLGIKTDPRFRPQFQPAPPGPLETRRPSPYAGYFELAFVLDSVAVAAGADNFTMLELGAGYGPWLVTAHRARQLSAGRSIRLIGVEMVAQHFEWMHDHLAHNGIDVGQHRLIHAAVSDVDGVAFYRPERKPWLDFGQTVTKRCAKGPDLIESGGDETIETSKQIRVPAVGLSGLLRDLERVDLLHADMQGEEGRAFPAAIEELNRHVGRLIVATHSRPIHRRLRRLLADAGWEIVFDFRCRKWERTDYGDVKFLDGLLAAVNVATK
jgi:FkbM family methyltransferase